MGTEISQTRFSQQELKRFRARLRRETLLLRDWLANERLTAGPVQAGYELEAWLIDTQGRPSAKGSDFIASLPAGSAVPELARFNLEINGAVHDLGGACLSTMHQELQRHWQDLSQRARDWGLRLLMIGSHPQAERADFCLANMSPLQRYQALNRQVFAQRHAKPIELDISGREQVHLSHPDVMLEAATTSFQIHLRCAPAEAACLYNLSKIVSAPLVALSANSPFLFGRDLWAESRIPLFEQAIDVGASDLTKRVSFGIRYAEQSIFEVFAANLERYPVLLPEVMDSPDAELAHLRLHNGTIWRWNRPLIGFDPDGRPHLRIEQRVVPAGPSPCDCIANAAFYLGLTRHLLQTTPGLVQRIPFATAKANFYACARLGLEAEVVWDRRWQGPVRHLILERLLPEARLGLADLRIEAAEIDHWLGIVRDRVTSGQTGSQWQRDWVARHGRDFRGMIDSYLDQQQADRPVHRWALD